MNWLFFIEATFTGVLAGYVTWLLAPAGNNWDILCNFETSLLSVGIFCGLFVGIFRCLPIALREKRFLKTIKFLIFGVSTGLSISMLGSVVFTMLTKLLIVKLPISDATILILWWTWLGLCIASCFGFLYKSSKILSRAFIGLTPGLIISGLAMSKYFIPNEQYLLATVFTGAISAISLALAWEILKDAWLDEELTSFICYRFFLDNPDYYIGSSDLCDLTLYEGPERLVCISEKNGFHILEVLNNKHYIKVNTGKFRYKVLVDGDILSIGDRCLVYHSHLSRSRDTLPEALAG